MCRIIITVICSTNNVLGSSQNLVLAPGASIRINTVLSNILSLQNTRFKTTSFNPTGVVLLNNVHHLISVANNKSKSAVNIFFVLLCIQMNFPEIIPRKSIRDMNIYYSNYSTWKTFSKLHYFVSSPAIKTWNSNNESVILSVAWEIMRFVKTAY